MRMRTWLVSALSAAAIAVGLILVVGITAGTDANEAQAMTPDPTLQDTARLLGYMWGDGEQAGNGVWDVNGPSGTSSLIEELIDRHGTDACEAPVLCPRAALANTQSDHASFA